MIASVASCSCTFSSSNLFPLSIGEGGNKKELI
jgi:hypothetical protein